MASTSSPFPTSGSANLGSSGLNAGTGDGAGGLSSSQPSSSASGLSSSGTAAAGGSASMDRMVQSAHEAVDRFAEKAGPALEKLRNTMGSATEKLPMSKDELSAMQREWVASTRDMVREHPLATVAVAVAAGVLLSRMLSSR